MPTRMPRAKLMRADAKRSSTTLPIWAVCGSLLAIAVALSDVPGFRSFVTPILGALLIYAGAILIKHAGDD